MTDTKSEQTESVSFDDWLTLEEFQKNPVNDWYWIYYCNANVELAYYDNGNFYFNEDDRDLECTYTLSSISHVMPKTISLPLNQSTQTLIG